MYSVARKGHPFGRVLIKCLRKCLDVRVLLYDLLCENYHVSDVYTVQSRRCDQRLAAER